jgi:uncharacterized PurR-regulated membrane protein YhhQ (DUF165 family)
MNAAGKGFMELSRVVSVQGRSILATLCAAMAADKSDVGTLTRLGRKKVSTETLWTRRLLSS